MTRQPTNPYDSYWQVPESGFHWLDKVTPAPGEGAIRLIDPPPFLCPVADSQTGRWRLYDPLRDEPGLFRTFADLETSLDSILAFANQYGSMGGDAVRQMLIPGNGEPRYMESFSAWAKQILIMKRAVGLLEMVQKEDAKGLASCIHWKDGGVYYEDSTDAWWHMEWLATPGDHQGRLAYLDRGDVIGPAHLILQKWINKEITAGAAPMLLWVDSLRTQMKLRIRPNSLIGALWLQLAQAIDGGRDYRQCAECAKWFEVSTERGNPRKYCSGACRTKAYRRTKTENQQ